MRTAVSLIAVAVLAASLTACTQAPAKTDSTSSPVASAAACATTGAASEAVKVTGDFGTKPTVEFDKPLAAKTTTERTVVTEGTGDQVVAGDEVNVDFTVLNATDGTELTATPYDGATYGQFTVDESLALPGLAKTIACSTLGSRVVGVIPPAESWDGQGYADLKVAATDSIVFVVDIISIVPPAAAAEIAPYDDLTDMPTVVFGDDGVPTVTMPAGVAVPDHTKIGIIKEGDGAVVKSGDNVTVNYHGVLWDDGTVFDSSYQRGEPASFVTTGVVTGFKEALEGQKVGSQIVAVLTPEDGYGASGSGSIPANATLVFVIDIISVG